MKNLCLFLLLILLLGKISFSQSDTIKIKPCENVMIARQADSLKKDFTANGFILLKEASVTMKSAYELPVILPLNEGSLYQFIFIGDYTCKLYEVRLYNWNEKQVIFRQKRWGDVEGNIISFPYRSSFSEYHMMKSVQVNKKKNINLCGYVMLFKKV